MERGPVWVGPKDHKLVGECLAAARKRAGVTQDQLSVLLKKPQSFVSAYERGQRRVDLLEFLLIAAALKLDARQMFTSIAEQASKVLKQRPAQRRGRR